MNKKILLAAVCVVIAVAGLMLNGGLSGYLVFEDKNAPTITVTEAKILDTSAHIKWETDEPARSTFSIGDSTETFPEARQFETRLESMSPGKEYSYAIYACDKSDNCNLAEKRFTTLLTRPPEIPEPKASPLTGAVVANVTILQAKLNTVLFLLIAGVAVFVLLSGTLQRLETDDVMPNSVRMHMLLNKAEKSIKSKRHHEAFPIYEEMRHLYEKLNSRQKGTHHSRVMDVYSELHSHTKAKEANHLVDKYLEGKISRPEMDRLRDLLEH